MKRQSLHVRDNAIYDQFTKQQVIWTHGYGATDRYVTRNEWGALLLQWPVLCETPAQQIPGYLGPVKAGWFVLKVDCVEKGWWGKLPLSRTEPKSKQRAFQVQYLLQFYL